MTDPAERFRIWTARHKLQTKRIRKALNDMMPASAWRSQRFGMAGSCALHMYQMGHAWPWCHWHPRNVDLFFCGDDVAFLQCRKMIWSSLDRKRYKFLHSCTSLYTHGGKKKFRWDFAISGIHPLFTLRQVTERTLEKAVEGFQIDVSRVIYDVVRDGYVLDPDTARSIESRTVSVDSVAVDRDAPSHLEIKAICRTYYQMMKYYRRFFTLTSIPQIVRRRTLDRFRTNAPVTISYSRLSVPEVPLELRPVAERWPRHRIFSEFENIVAFVKKVIPESFLMTHPAIGIVGEYPLVYHLAKMDIEGTVPRIHLWKPREVVIVCCDPLDRADQGAMARLFGVAKLKKLGYHVRDRNLIEEKDPRGDRTIGSTLRFRIEEIDVVFVVQRFRLGPSVRNVVRSFASNTNRFFYNFREERVQSLLSERTLYAIEHGEVPSRPIYCARCPGPEQIVQLRKVLTCMQKYKRQGFAFTSYPILNRLEGIEE